MKLSDIDNNLNEAPVGMLGRAATKLKKHTPFNAGARARATGRDKLQKAANQLNLEWQEFSGQAGFDKNKISVDNLMAFFTDNQFAKSAEQILMQHPKVKAWMGQQQIQQDDTPRESLEYRLSAMLGEAEVDATDINEVQVYFDNKEVEQLILKITELAQQNNPKAFSQVVAAKQKELEGEGKVKKEPASASKEEPEEQPQGDEADNIQQLEAMWDEMVRSLSMDDTSAQIMKAAFDNARKKVLSGEIGDFNTK